MDWAEATSLVRTFICIPNPCPKDMPNDVLFTAENICAAAGGASFKALAGISSIIQRSFFEARSATPARIPRLASVRRPVLMRSMALRISARSPARIVFASIKATRLLSAPGFAPILRAPAGGPSRSTPLYFSAFWFFTTRLRSISRSNRPFTTTNTGGWLVFLLKPLAEEEIVTESRSCSSTSCKPWKPGTSGRLDFLS